MTPVASVVVPSFARPDALAECLNALTLQTLADVEIIVVDDGSPEPLEAICARFQGVRCITQGNAGPAAARNTGAHAARSPFLAFTDDDCRPHRDWLLNLLKAHNGIGSRLVGGTVRNGLPNNPFTTASQDLCDFLYDWFGAAQGTIPYFTSNNLGCARDRFLLLGGFDQTFPLAAAEDREFCARWRKDGGELVYAEEAVIHHFHTLTARSFWRQHRNYGVGARHLHRVLQKSGSNVPRREPARFYLSLLAHPIRKRGLLGLQGSVLALLSQVAMVFGYLSEIRQSKLQRKQ